MHAIQFPFVKTRGPTTFCVLYILFVCLAHCENYHTHNLSLPVGGITNETLPVASACVNLKYIYSIRYKSIIICYSFNLFGHYNCDSPFSQECYKMAASGRETRTHTGSPPCRQPPTFNHIITLLLTSPVHIWIQTSSYKKLAKTQNICDLTFSWCWRFLSWSSGLRQRAAIWVVANVSEGHAACTSELT
jgi:hypothetical protein